METLVVENLDFKSLISMASTTRCNLDVLEAEILRRMRARRYKQSSKHYVHSRVRAVSSLEQNK